MIFFLTLLTPATDYCRACHWVLSCYCCCCCSVCMKLCFLVGGEQLSFVRVTPTVYFVAFPEHGASAKLNQRHTHAQKDRERERENEKETWMHAEDEGKKLADTVAVAGRNRYHSSCWCQFQVTLSDSLSFHSSIIPRSFFIHLSAH